MRAFILFIFFLFPFQLIANYDWEHKPFKLQLTDKSYTLFLSDNMEMEDKIKFFNIFASSISYSLATNQILNGSGTKTPFFSIRKSDTILRRLLNVFSFYDLYFTSQVHRFVEENLEKGEESYISAIMAPMDISYLETLDAPYAESFALPLYSALEHIFPVFNFQVKEIPLNAYQIEKGDIKYTNSIFTMKVRQGLVHYYDELVKKAKLGMANQPQRLASLFALYLPLASQFHFYLRKEQNEESSFVARVKYSLFFPAIGKLDRTEQDSRLWSIKGLSMPLDLAIKTDFAVMDSYSYHSSEKRDSFPFMKLSILKDFRAIHEAEVSFTFGIQGGSKPSKIELISMGSEDFDDRLIVSGYVYLSKVMENPIIKLLPQYKRDELTKYMKEFKIEVGIRKATFKLVREGGADFERSLNENKSFDFEFNPDKSEFTYRLTKVVSQEGLDKKYGVHKHLKKLGFQCEELQGMYRCVKEFKDSKSLADKLSISIFNAIARKTLKIEVPKMQESADKALSAFVGDLFSEIQETKKVLSILGGRLSE